ncbi:hypothetical protein FC35_GL001209 [Limosilactobacillus coleohominis DSM 14060]|nr:hypothetical protein FC35_GL001209 [Limosilactobacillus coleohominis DSM 14060]
MFYVVYQSQAGNKWFWTVDKTFSKSKQKLMKYQSKKVALRALKNALKKYPNKFRKHPLHNCKIISADDPTISYSPLTDLALPVSYCLGRRLGAKDPWLFLTSKGTFAGFNNNKKSVFNHLEDCRAKALAYYKSGEAQLAIFDANQDQLIETIQLTTAVNSKPEVSKKEVMDALDVLLRASNYAKQLTQQVFIIDHSEMIDLMHFIEFSQLTDQQKVQLIDKIHAIRQERRKMKDLLVFLKAIRENIDFNKIIREIDESKVLLGNERSYTFRDSNLKKWLDTLKNVATEKV